MSISIESRLACLAAQENCDGSPWNEIQEAADTIRSLRATSADLLAALELALPLLELVTVRQVIEGGHSAIEAAGLNPYCMNEGRATGDETIDTWRFHAAIAKAKGGSNA